jgi:carboxyl-terminal processing protease
VLLLKKIFLAISLLFVICLNTANAQIFFNEHTFKIGKLLHFIEKFYVDTVNEKDLVESAITYMLKELDPHSLYIPAEEVKAMNEPLEGNFEGIGVTFNLLDDTIYIISPISGGPSEKVGIMAGDRIVKIEGENVAGVGITNKQVRDRLLGKKGTKVNVGIKRSGVKDLLDFQITRDRIPIYSIDAIYMADDSIGYIKLSRFAATTYGEFTKAIDSLKRQNCKHLVIDLTNNGGGYLEIAVRLVEQFLENNKLIVYTEGRAYPRFNYNSGYNGDFRTGNVVVMLDEGSASASEIVAGAIQDWDRGVIVGRRSFGKGLVQRSFELPDSSIVRLTIAHYFTPTGRSIQKPYQDGKDAYEKELIERYKHGEYFTADSISFPDSLKHETLVNKRIVYGGGGIMPDVFIPLDTTNYSEYYRKLIARGIINKFTINYIDNNRKSLKKLYPDFKVFINTFIVTDKMLMDLQKLATDNKIDFVENEFNISKQQIEVLIKAYIARDLWTSSEFYQILNPIYPIYNESIEILKSTDKYNSILKK